MASASNWDAARHRVDRRLREPCVRARARKWRPSLSLVVFLVLTSVLLLPLFSLYFLKVYQNQLIQQTEAELIAQSAALSAAFHREIETAIPQGTALGARDSAGHTKAARTNRISRSGRSWNWSNQSVLPPRPEARAAAARRPIPPSSRSARA